MSNENSLPKSFIEEAEALILTHVENENFGVSELADAMHMSRSNLLRKIKKSTKRISLEKREILTVDNAS